MGGENLEKAAEALLADIRENGRTFLPGAPPSLEEVRATLSGSILLGGLTPAESWLVLSTLPKGVNHVFFYALDKGLSGSKVYSGQYRTNGMLSRPFVFKIGTPRKLASECDGIERLVTPHIAAVSRPIFRTDGERALLVQDFAGLHQQARLQSLKEVARQGGGHVAVKRLLQERLAPWYRNGSEEMVDHLLGATFEWHMKKVAGAAVFPPAWEDLKTRVEDLTGYAWRDPVAVVERLMCQVVRSRAAVVHGDLHAQNVLVDERGDSWPIDFAWVREKTTPLLDFTMLECSLKFLALPARSDLADLIRLESQLAAAPLPRLKVAAIPYCDEIRNVMRTVREVRRIAFDEYQIGFDDYRKALCLMTYVHSTHPLLNRPLVLASLQMLCAIQEERR